nr:MAG TPA: hypothetical protein [Caudoviricetes sp.]
MRLISCATIFRFLGGYLIKTSNYILTCLKWLKL